MRKSQYCLCRVAVNNRKIGSSARQICWKILAKILDHASAYTRRSRYASSSMQKNVTVATSAEKKKVLSFTYQFTVGIVKGKVTKKEKINDHKCIKRG
jgi:hypothetical protein